VIVRLVEGLDVVPMLGAHHWKSLHKAPQLWKEDQISLIFEYDYTIAGDPVQQGKRLRISNLNTLKHLVCRAIHRTLGQRKAECGRL
jgi:hypothetical protein